MKKIVNKSLYKSHRVIYTDPVPGYFNNIRFACMSFVVIIFFLVPWLPWNNSQAFLFDVMTARLYVFGLVFWPEDFSLFAILGIFLILALFALTVYSGRVWCGFFCPQSVWLRIVAFFSRVIEGKRNKRKRQDMNVKNSSIILKKTAKHVICLCFAFVTALTFVGYFVPILSLVCKISAFDFYSWSIFWLIFFLLLTYFNAVWFREQFCFLVCPYARLQSVMFDENTLIVAYNRKRGEKRGSRKRGIDHKSIGLGDCIDCKKCVTCCPTGIDIRDGLQMECISCAACVDACNSVMESMSYDKNLIGYMREGDLTGYKKKTNSIRLLAYVLLLSILFALFVFSLYNRQLIQFNVTRSQLQLYNISNHKIENVYSFKITNKTQASHSYAVSIIDPKFKYIGIDKFVLGREETVLIDAKLLLPESDVTSRFIEVLFKVQCIDDPSQVVYKKSQFVKPLRV